MPTTPATQTTPPPRIATLRGGARGARGRARAGRRAHARARPRCAPRTSGCGSSSSCLRRRIFVAKAERVDTRAARAGVRGTSSPSSTQLGGHASERRRDAGADSAASATARRSPNGRRDLRKRCRSKRSASRSPTELFEELVAEGKAERIGFEESCKLAWQRGGHASPGDRAREVPRRRRAAASRRSRPPPMPHETFARSLAAPSLLAHVATDKYCDGLPLYRIEDRFARDGVAARPRHDVPVARGRRGDRRARRWSPPRAQEALAHRVLHRDRRDRRRRPARAAAPTGSASRAGAGTSSC